MENVDVVRAIEEAWASNDLDALDQYFAPNWQPHTPGSDDIGSDLNVVKGAHQHSMQAYPDKQNTVRDIIAEGDLVVSRVEMTGTNVEHWRIQDIMGAMGQLGLLPPPPDDHEH